MSEPRDLQNGEFLSFDVPVGRREMVMSDGRTIFFPQTIVDRAKGLELQEFTLLHNGEKTTFDYSHESDMTKITKSLNYVQNILLGDCDCGTFVFRKA